MATANATTEVLRFAQNEPERGMLLWGDGEGGVEGGVGVVADPEVEG